MFNDFYMIILAVLFLSYVQRAVVQPQLQKTEPVVDESVKRQRPGFDPRVRFLE